MRFELVGRRVCPRVRRCAAVCPTARHSSGPVGAAHRREGERGGPSPPVRERLQLFGDQGAMAAAQPIEISARTARGTAQGTLCPSWRAHRPPRRSRVAESCVAPRTLSAETRDSTRRYHAGRVHAAIFQARRRTPRSLLEAETGATGGPGSRTPCPRSTRRTARSAFDAMLVAVS
jgi:hypothetical protein